MRISICVKCKWGINLKSAEMATAVSKHISNQLAHTVELDFAGVEFISRSFADQLYTERVKLRNEGISVFMINMDEGVERIIDAIARIHSGREQNLISLNKQFAFANPPN